MLLRILCAHRHGLTLKDLAREMNVSERTIRRDLLTFQMAGFPLQKTAGEYNRKSWRIDHRDGQPEVSFAFDEAVALYLGRHLMEPLAGTPFWEAARRAFRKIRVSFGPGARNYVDKFRAMFHQTAVGVRDYSDKTDLIDDLIDDLTQAIEDCRMVNITYQSLNATESTAYDIYPHGLAYHRNSLYVVGWAPRHEQFRIWKVDRIEAAHLEDLRFERREDFDLEAHFAKSFGVFHGDGDVHVKIRFSSRAARYVREGTWHHSQTLTPQKDGSLLAEFDLDGTEEIKRWVLSFGREAEVVGPEELRTTIAEEARNMFAEHTHEHRAEEKYDRSHRV